MTTSPINLGSWLTWTPNLSYTSHADAGHRPAVVAGPASARATSSPASTRSFGDTLRRNAYTATSRSTRRSRSSATASGTASRSARARNDFPERAIVDGRRDRAWRQERIYAHDVQHRRRLDALVHAAAARPEQVQPDVPRCRCRTSTAAPFWIRNERTGGKWVHQIQAADVRRRRPSPTLYGLFIARGFGPFTRIRHSISARRSATRTRRAADVSDEYLAALGRRRPARPAPRPATSASLAQNSLNLGLSTNIEAKLRSHERLATPRRARRSSCCRSTSPASSTTSSAPRRRTRASAASRRRTSATPSRPTCSPASTSASTTRCSRARR